MRNPNRETVFNFKQFAIANSASAMKVGTDGVLLGAWASGCGLRILDIGCGTGLIALMMAQRFPAATVVGVEIDPAAASEAASNFSNSPWANRLQAIQGDICQLSAEALGGRFDIIVSNPPFFANGIVSPEAARQQARHESALSLEKLLSVAANLLTDNGSFSVILPADREQDLKYQAVVSKLALVRLTRVTTVPRKPAKRLMAELRPSANSGCQEAALSIRGADGEFSQEYINLVKDFYLNL
jgi:tRNA1Val (adenine37-N6)-methyltransferase